MVLTAASLTAMRDVDIRTVDRDTLVDINDVEINMDLPPKERTIDFLEKIKNPYCFSSDNLVIKIGFIDTEVSLQEKIEQYLKSL